MSSNHGKNFSYGLKVKKKKNPCQKLSFLYRVGICTALSPYNIKKEQKFPQSTFFFCAGFSFDFSASTLFGSIIPLLEVLSQGIRTSHRLGETITNPKMHLKDLTVHIKNKQQKERKDGVGESVWQNRKLKAVFQVGSRQGMD